MTLNLDVTEAIRQISGELLQRQQPDGSWRFPFDGGTSPDAYFIIVLRTLEHPDEELIRKLHDRIKSVQQPDGSWKVYKDEPKGNLSASVDAYYALLYSGYSSEADESMQLARRFIASRGGLRKVNSVLTKTFLAATGQYPWPTKLILPIELLLFPPHFPVNLFDFSAYGRVHFVPIMLLADRRYAIKTPVSPDLFMLIGNRDGDGDAPDETEPGPSGTNRGLDAMLDAVKQAVSKLAGFPAELREQARRKAERFMLDRIEADGTLYSYGTSTLLMIMALLSLGYGKRHPVIVRAIEGLASMLGQTEDGKHVFLQNTPSAVWDTALLSHALQEAGLPARHPAIGRAANYLLGKQHRSLADWSLRNPNPVPGGWGFSDSNAINPDVDDTTAALRAIARLRTKDERHLDAWNRGLNWVLSMQNRDGGWAAFEKDTDKEWLTWLPVDGAKSVAIDPSTADLTGRTLEFLGSAGLDVRLDYILHGSEWLFQHQEKDGSWYGRWGICYLYGTWSALTGLLATGTGTDNGAVRRGVRFLLNVQNADGGWGESCRSDVAGEYVPLRAGTPSQTAWALDALIAAHAKPSAEIDRGIRSLLDQLQAEPNWTHHYPTGAGLPGLFYSDYYSYKTIWPLLTLAHYEKFFR
ncbi:squalene--hopene cyclase [Paenibacillus thailandensis]|uniref:Squalene--hopene cyclase n=1 Tax=Paenibacillus thailandensis TaxID=393250 RepID=A0ABW5QU63_9BACL